MTETKTESCRTEKCKREVRAKGYCDRHYRAWRRGELAKPRYKLCKAEGCKKPMVGEGYCQTHFDSWKSSRKHVVRLQKAATAAAAPPAPAPVAPKEEPTEAEKEAPPAA